MGGLGGNPTSQCYNGRELSGSHINLVSTAFICILFSVPDVRRSVTGDREEPRI